MTDVLYGLDLPAESKHTLAYCAARHLQGFLDSVGHPEHVAARITTRAGGVFVSVGFWVAFLEDNPRCALIHGQPVVTNDALVIRDDDIASIEFHVFEPESEEDVTPFGFYPKKND